MSFTFDGRGYQGFAGDTLASALLAQGVRLFGRSFKYHRPRGLLAAGTEEPNALVTVIRDAARRTPNVQATQVEMYEGLVAESQNRWPSLDFDLNAVNNFLSPLLTSGFYYKTFMWPRLRGTAGTSRSSVPLRDLRMRHDCRIRTGTRSGLRTATCWLSAPARRVSLRRSRRQRPARASSFATSRPEFGGSLLDQPTATINERPAALWIDETWQGLVRSRM